MTTEQAIAVPETMAGEGAGVPPRRGRRPVRNLLIASAFLAPALILLGALVAYPVIYSIGRSLYDAQGSGFVGLENYATMFTDPATFTAIRNNVIWVVVVPISCTILGLIFAVLLDKIKWGIAFKLIVFMPMAISMVAAGVIFRTTFQENPQLGAVNAALVGIHDTFSPEQGYPGARPRPDEGASVKDGAVVSGSPVSTGDSALFPLVGVGQSDIPASAADATEPPRAAGDEITGTVWVDFVRGGGGENGKIGDGKKGMPGVTVNALAPDGTVAGSARTEADGTFAISGLTSGDYTIQLPPSNFREPYKGVSWLGPSLVTAVIILSYIWIWAGFAMVMIASGLSAMDRNLQEAARIDGASEWKVFTRITAPLLAPVLIVVFVTLIINVLKIFDLVYVIPPASSLPDATVIAVQMWAVSFGGGNNQGLGSALAILLLILVLPSMIINIRRFKQERER